MKPASNFNPISPQGRHSSVSPSAYGSDTVLPSHSSQASLKALNDRPGTSEPFRLSFASNTSLHELKGVLARKQTGNSFKATSEVDILEEETPAVSRRRAYTSTRTPILIPSAFKPGQIQKISSLKASGSFKNTKQNESTEKVPTLVKKKTGAGGSSPENRRDSIENKRDLLNSPFRLEKMFAQKVGVVAKRRKSCHCEWCGGMSSLEKKLSKNPNMAFSQRKRKSKKEETVEKEEEATSFGGERLSKTSLAGSRTKLKGGKSGPKGKSLFHSKTLGIQKLGSLASSPKPSNSQERALSIDNEYKSRRSMAEDLCSWKDMGKLEDGIEEVRIDLTRNASLVIEQEEEEAQNISIEEGDGAKPKKKKRGKKSIKTNIKLELKMNKVSEPSCKDVTSPMNNRGSVRKSVFVLVSPGKKEVKSYRNDKFTKVLKLDEDFRNSAKTKAPDSPNKFIWDKFTNQASDILSVYSQKQTLSPHSITLSRTPTEPQSQAPQIGKLKYSVLAWNKKTPILSPKKQASEPSFIIKSNLTNLSRFHLERSRGSIQENDGKTILDKRFSNFTVREGMSSPLSVSQKGERKKIGSRQMEKQVYTVRHNKQGK